jgi:signal transduction histidine kinase
MFLDANLAERHSDVAELLMDHTIESYVGMRLDSAQGEIMGVIGIIHDKHLTQEDGSIVKMVLSQVGARVANELDRLRIEANLIYARDVAESTAKNKTKFLADMSHEIRQVLHQQGFLLVLSLYLDIKTS